MTEELRDDNGKPFPKIVPEPAATQSITLSDVFALIETFDTKHISKQDLTKAVTDLAAA